MHHLVVRILADIAILLLVGVLPFLYLWFSDRFRRPLSPDQYATLLGVALLAGILLFLPTISVVAAVALLALGLAWLTGHFALTGVSYQRHLSQARLFPGENTELTIELSNRKILPLPSITVTDPMHFATIRANEAPERVLRFSGGIERQDVGHALVNRAALGPFQMLRRTYRVEALRRGIFRFGPATIETSDLFGIFERDGEYAGRMEILVYPRIFSPSEIDLPFRQILGELVARRALVEDPVLLAGSREYRPGDPLSRMHWKATARTGELQVRLADPSTTAQIMTVVNLNTFQHVWQGVDPERMETAISVAASLSLEALRRGFAVGIRTNGILAGEDSMEGAPRLAPSASVKQEAVLLEHLARLAFSGRIAAERVLLDEAQRLAPGSSVLFVTPTLTPELITVLTSRQLAGRITVVYCGRFAAPVVRGLPVHLVIPPRETVRAVS